MTTLLQTPPRPEPGGKTRVGRMSDERCPKCGSTLLTNDYGQLWCSYVGGGGPQYNGCTYGMGHDDDCAVAYVKNYGGGNYGQYPCDCGYEEAHRDKAGAA